MYVTKSIHGSIMYLDTDDPGLSADLWRDGTREWNCPELVAKIVRPGWKCIDIGANLGLYALLEAKLAGPEGMVFAVEPAPKSVELLRMSAKANEYKNLEIYECAIGDYNGVNRFLLRKYSNLCRMEKTRARDVEPAPVIDVPQYTLDEFCEIRKTGPINFLRFDVESYEVELIEGAQRTLAEMPVGSWIFGEFHACHFDDPVRDLMPAIQSVLNRGFVQRFVVPIPQLEAINNADFPRAVCTDFAQYAPRVFLEKVRL